MDNEIKPTAEKPVIEPMTPAKPEQADAAGTPEQTAAAQQNAAVTEAKAAPVAAPETSQEVAPENGNNEDDGYVPVAIIDYDEYDSAVEEAATASSQRRARLASGEDVAERPRYVRGKLTPKEWWSNFLYHNKTTIIIIVVAAVLLGIALWQSRPAKIDYYITLYATGGNAQHTGITKLTETLTACGEDVDGNGEVSITIPDQNFFSQEPYMGAVAVLTFDQDAKGLRQSSLMLLDKEHYDSIVENYGEEIFEQRHGLPRWIPIKDTSFGRAIRFDESDPETDDLGFSLMVYPEGLDLSKRKMKRAIDYYTNAAALLDNILEAYPDLVTNAQQAAQ